MALGARRGLARRGIGDCAGAIRARTGAACVSCSSFSLVEAGSSERAWPSLECWLLILIRAGSTEPGAPSLGAAAFVAISWGEKRYKLRVAACTHTLVLTATGIV